MVESSSPAVAAVVAAPILKLCPAWSLAGRLAADKAWRVTSTNFVFNKGILLSH